MRNLLRHLRAAWLFIRVTPYRAVPRETWTDGNAARWQSFQNEETGLKLIALVNDAIALQSMKAVMKTDNQSYECGYAAGMMGLLAVLRSFSPAPSDSGNTEENPAMGADDFEHLSP